VTLKKRFKKCHDKTQIGKKKKFKEFFLITNLYYNYKWLLLIFEFYLRPILCFFSFLTNLLTIILIRNRNDVNLKKNFNNIMYKHILAYSGFNMIYSLITLFSLINICIFPGTSYCSNIYRSKSAQIFKIYIYYLLSNTFRLSSNISYISFSISRYFLSTSHPSKYFKKFQNLNYKIFPLFCFCLVCLLAFLKYLNLK
jgi:hypothetical protein